VSAKVVFRAQEIAFDEPGDGGTTGVKAGSFPIRGCLLGRLAASLWLPLNPKRAEPFRCIGKAVSSENGQG
jgi:hypothetical protein